MARNRRRGSPTQVRSDTRGGERDLLRLNLDVLSQWVETKREAEREIERSVIAARKAGATWTVLGGLMGISPQAVQKRFGGVARIKGETPFMVKVWRG